jgi:hypothetical protein
MANGEETTDVARAAFSVFYTAQGAIDPDWSEGRPGKAPPRELLPMDIGAALRVLRQDPLTRSYRLAASALAHAMTASETHEVMDHLGNLLSVLPNASDILQEVLHASRPSDAYLAVYSGIGSALELGACTLKNYELRATYDAKFSIADAYVSIDVDGQVVSQFFERANPANWAVTAPQFFDVSDPLNPNLLLEKAKWTIGPSTISKYENILWFDYKADVEITLDYRLHEARRITLPFYDGPGGLDRDSGQAHIRVVDGACRISASKSLRHALPIDVTLNRWINWTSLPFVVYLMNYFVVGGAC